MNLHEEAAPVEEKFLTPGVMVLLAFMAVGLVFAAARFILGIGAVSNLNNQFPWGIWIGVDVASGVALTAGGFTTGAIAYVFNRDQYHAVIRPALLTAMLGYTFVVLGLLVAACGRLPAWLAMTLVCLFGIEQGQANTYDPQAEIERPRVGSISSIPATAPSSAAAEKTSGRRQAWVPPSWPDQSARASSGSRVSK